MKDEPPPHASSTDHEPFMGSGVIVNDGSKSKGEPWIVSAGNITNVPLRNPASQHDD